MVRGFVLITLVSSVLLGNAAKAAIVHEITEVSRLDRTPIPEDLWDFDFDLQVLTLTDFVYEVGEQPYPIWSHRAVRVVGFADPDSQFTFVRHFTNLTDVPLTGFTTSIASTIITASTIVPESAWATGSPEIYYDDAFSVELVWVDPIPVGGSFTFQLDIYNYRPLTFTLIDTAVPEPATMVLFGLGGLALLRNRRHVGSKEKA